MSDISPAVPSSNRLLKAVVIGLGVLIVIGLGALAFGVVAKLGGRAPAHASADTGAFALPPGSKIVEMQTQSGRLILHVQSKDGEEIDIVDISDGHLVARVK